MPESKSRKKQQAYVPPPPVAPVAKPNPAWFIPVIIALFAIALVWIVVTYFSEGNWPLPIGNWNLAVGFGIALVGFGMLTRWR